MDIIKNNNDLHIEVQVNELQHKKDPKLEKEILSYLKSLKNKIEYDEELKVPETEGFEKCQRLWIEKNIYSSSGNSVTEKDFENVAFHFFVPNDDRNEDTFELEFLDNQDENHEAGAGGQQPSIKHYLMPAKSFVGLWSSLKMSKDIKERLLRYSLCGLLLRKHNMDPNKISCNNLIVLYGPPGTGKTSLCKALAQKISIRLQDQFTYTHLIEINSHSLLSKWFSESGKLIARLFKHIRELANDSKNLVVVLIDEVESIAYERSSLNGQEPKDAMRVVNSFLTELDSIKLYQNILVLATSNLENSIDSAFMDRADLMLKINLPNEKARHLILKGVWQELFDKKLIECQDEVVFNKWLDRFAYVSNGLSGRALNKLPFGYLCDLTSHDSLLKPENFFQDFEVFIINYVNEKSIQKNQESSLKN